MDTVGQTQMTQYHSPTPNTTIASDAGATSNPSATRQRTVSADMDIVPDLYQIVDFHTVFDDGVVQGASIDTTVGTDFNIVTNKNRSQLLNFHPDARMSGKAKTIGTDRDTGVQDTARTDATAVTYSDMRLEPTASSHAGAPFDDAKWADPGARVNLRLRMDTGTGMVHRRIIVGGLELPPPLSQPGKVKIGVRCFDTGGQSRAQRHRNLIG